MYVDAKTIFAILFCAITGQECQSLIELYVHPEQARGGMCVCVNMRGRLIYLGRQVGRREELIMV